MAKKKETTNGARELDRAGHVSLAREEYEAYQAREESFEKLSADNARLVNTRHDQAELIDQQMRRLVESDQIVERLQRVLGLQRELIEALRDPQKVAAMEDLTKFWNAWVSATGNLVAKHPNMNAEVAKLEPDLFKSWRAWVRDAGKADRAFSLAGMSRTEVEAAQPKTAKELQEHMIRRLQEQGANSAARVKQLEAELAAAKAKPAAEEKKP